MRYLMPAILMLALSGCALSPQMITVQPSPEVTAANVGNNQSVTVSTVDQREQQAFGTRGGVYGNTSLIRPANDLAAVITDAVRKGLQAQGFNAFNPNDDGRPLEVRIATLSYVPEEGSVVNRVEVNTVIEALARNPQGDEYKGVYRAGNTYEQPLTPSAARNEMMINEVLDRALKQLLADPKLLSFMAAQ